MQYQPITGKPPQLSLFEGLIAHSLTPFADIVTPPPADDRLSEMTLSGSNGHCRLLLAPILRELSEATDTRWLTLIAPPASLSQRWLRETSLNLDRILLLPANESQGALDLACKALISGCSHTVVTWFARLDRASRSRLRAAAELGHTQSLNIRLGN
ncbi:SOS-induced cell division inhibitor SulA [Stutzerimonas nitrititolerans]|uniref:SulA-like leucine-rich domain-containing protein n=1 Tax=Stutzerimonas nitrititolerans TaxID=2482751 RepID=A0AA41WKT7_9GAMM|nr:SOS-induced cell division inhibitor SulA [Stutzerimonas nitrititolerans]KRW74105.1 cell division protein [Pseudomonas sp. TTU2014-066ASC]MBA1184967.1 cell division protein [Stutzerimonas stutzeri]RRV20152.1 cell division protein [Pseudomonas sp. s199]HBB78009.1 cell division protein [Pseudomonas sp.]MCO7544745.1 SulA-like leucine-rich domain-containing protein [Stutzerimonas nitrititolerans]